MDKQRELTMRFAKDLTLAFWIIASLLLFGVSSASGRKAIRQGTNPTVSPGFPGDALQPENRQPLPPKQAGNPKPPSEDEGQKSDTDDDEDDDDEWEA